MKTIEKPWIELGYEFFALEGPTALTVEGMSKKMGKNKSSFYHHFGELDIFINTLLRYHLDRAKIMAKEESECATLDEFIDTILDHKTDLLFSRQLRVHRTNPEFAKCFEKVNEISIPAILGLWAELLGLQDKSFLSGLVFNLSLENFYLQITEQTLNKTWLMEYFSELNTLVNEFKKTGQPPPMNGTV